MQKDQILSVANNWTAEFNDLPKEDDLGEKYEYEVKEDSSSVVNGNAKTGYEVAYEVKKSTDKSTGITTISTDITNTHSPDSTTKSIQKKWSDNNDSDGIRPDSVKFNLVGNGKVADTATLSEKNGWKATSKLVPKKENGKAITYTRQVWSQERVRSDIRQLIQPIKMILIQRSQPIPIHREEER